MGAQKFPPIATKISHHICGFKENPNYEISSWDSWKTPTNNSLKEDVPASMFLVLKWTPNVFELCMVRSESENGHDEEIC